MSQFKPGEVKVGDVVYSSDTDYLFDKPVRQEWWRVIKVSQCQSSFNCIALVDGESGILYIDEIVAIKPRLKVV